MIGPGGAKGFVYGAVMIATRTPTAPVKINTACHWLQFQAPEFPVAFVKKCDTGTKNRSQRGM
jgi:hypothetical protein